MESFFFKLVDSVSSVAHSCLTAITLSGPGIFAQVTSSEIHQYH